MTELETIEQLEDVIIQLQKKISEQEIYIESIKNTTKSKHIGDTIKYQMSNPYGTLAGIDWAGLTSSSSSGSDIPF